MKVTATKVYQRQIRSALTAAERRKGEAEIVADPLAWPVIPGTSGARKARVARGGRGKSGGARVIYFYVVSPDHLFLLSCYTKTRQTDLSADQKKAVATAVREIKKLLKEKR